MKENRANRVLAALAEQGLTQMLITDPMSIYYLTGYQNQPFERFFGLLLRADENHAFFLNRLFPAPENSGITEVWYSDTDGRLRQQLSGGGPDPGSQGRRGAGEDAGSLGHQRPGHGPVSGPGP